MMMVTPPPFSAEAISLEADRAVTVLVELAEHVVGLREVGATGAKRVFEFLTW